MLGAHVAASGMSSVICQDHEQSALAVSADSQVALVEQYTMVLSIAEQGPAQAPDGPPDRSSSVQIVQ